MTLLAGQPTPELKSIPLIALSGYTGPADIQKARQAGFDRHVGKPPRFEQLESIMAELIGQSRRSSP